MSLYNVNVLAEPPILYYQLNETSGTAVVDTSGNSYTGVYSGGFTLDETGIPATGDHSVALDGTSGIITVGPSFDFHTDLNDIWTGEFWFQTTNYTQSGFLFQVGGFAVYLVSGVIWIQRSNSYIGVPPHGASINTGISIPNDALFHQYVLVIDNFGLIAGWEGYFYIDGVDQGIAFNPDAMSGNYGGGSEGISWGADNLGGNFVQGNFAELSLYNVALSATDIQNQHYDAGRGITPPGSGVGSLKIKPTDASGVHTLNIDVNGSSQSKLADATGTTFGTIGNPIYTDTSLPSSAIDEGIISINQTGSANGIQIASGPGMSSGNPLYIDASSGVFGTAQTYNTSISVVPGTPQTITATLVTSGKKGYLVNVYCFSQVAMSFLVQTIDASDTATNVFTVMNNSATPSAVFGPLSQLEVETVTGDGSHVAYQVIVTNLDTLTSNANVFVSWMEA